LSLERSDCPIFLEKVTKRFKGFEVLKGVSLPVPRNKITVILGYSGSGKSTIMKIIIGLYKADEGAVEVFSKDRTAMNNSELQKMRMRFGMLFQDAALFDDMSVFDNVAFPIREHRTDLNEAEIQEIVETKLKEVGLEEGYEKLPAQLSGGMRKRVGLARALALDPEILLYDEPTTGLDPVMTEMVNDLIVRTGREGDRTSLVISHDIHATVNIADQIAFLHEGQILYCGNAEGFINHDHPLIQKFVRLGGVDRENLRKDKQHD
jgi:phospholipid/cholesterol/gamma-HCH transport system ATP-binding protein